MRTVPAAAKAAMRTLDVKIDTDSNGDYIGKTYTTAHILKINIQRSITEGGIAIGNAISDRFSAVLRIDDKIPPKTRVKPYIRFSAEGDWIMLGKFYATECTKSRHSYINLVAYDFLNRLKINCTWKATKSGSVQELSFPATYHQMLDYIITRYNLACSFTCQEWTQTVKPEGYTYQQLLGFIASSHGCNCKIDDDGTVTFVPFAEITGSTGFSAANIIDQQIDDTDEGYTVNGLLITVGNESTIYIDDIAGSEYDEDAEGVLKINNPLASVAIAEYCWSLLGGLNYISTKITKRGTSALQCGDVFPVYDYAGEEPASLPNAIVTALEYEISTSGGFIETIKSYADKGEPVSAGKSGGSGSGGGTGKIKSANWSRVSTSNNTTAISLEIDGTGGAEEYVVYSPNNSRGACVARPGNAKAYTITSADPYGIDQYMSAALTSFVLSRGISGNMSGNILYEKSDEAPDITGGWYAPENPDNLIKGSDGMTLRKIGYLKTKNPISIEAGRYICIEYEKFTQDGTGLELKMLRYGSDAFWGSYGSTYAWSFLRENVSENGTVAHRWAGGNASTAMSMFFLLSTLSGKTSLVGTIKFKKIWLSDTLPPGAVEV